MMPRRVCGAGQSVTERSEAIMKASELPWWGEGREDEQRSAGVAER